MKANTYPLLSVFEPKQRLEVPLFQRQYVWTEEHQWEPLWADVSRKFGECLDGRSDAPVHFLGAMVFDQRLTPTGHVVRRQVIDGQQRLTTLQIFLAAFRDLCLEHGCADLAKECQSFTANTGMMANPEVDRHKVWPTTLDRSQFVDAMTSGSRAEVEVRHPVVRRKYARKPDPRPRMIEAYLYFYGQLAEFFLGTEDDPPLAGHFELAIRLEECLNTLRSSLQVVVIDLEQGDDAQVIFETLNARGEPLLPADLLRNFIFLRAGREEADQEQLYATYWRAFDDEFWRAEVRQGRLNRPRSDQFVQHYLSSRLLTDVSAKHLYVEYKHWIERDRPFDTIEDELRAFARQREHFRQLVEFREDHPLSHAGAFFETFEVSTVFPLYLFLMNSMIDEEELVRISEHLESYILRRAVCRLTTKNYNRVFLGVARSLDAGFITSEAVASQLRSFDGDSSEWPSDARFRDAWLNGPMYQVMNSARIAHVLSRINDTYTSNWSESLTVQGQLSVEHLMPQRWQEHWPLLTGVRGLTSDELSVAEPGDGTAQATHARNEIIHSFGNLTLVNQPLNSSMSDASWQKKRQAIRDHSVLPMNNEFQDFDHWDEESIRQRSQQLFDRALRLWPRP